jgi:hypothetical protein
MIILKVLGLHTPRPDHLSLTVQLIPFSFGLLVFSIAVKVQLMSL